jgi:ribulose-5-phosphate 4-epimerase/fuculose-1-phosphate aldolase
MASLGRWRTKLRASGLIGACPDGIGFGNLSVAVESPGEGAPGRIGSARETERQAERRPFLITGSGTGGLAELDASHYALVTDYHIEENSVACRGLTRASSESLSHAAVYAACPDAGAVFHIHSEALWKRWRGVLPTTEAALAYGTPEIALALGRLARELGHASPGGPAHRSHMTIVMGGHRDGLIQIGRSLDEAGSEFLRLSRTR